MLPYFQRASINMNTFNSLPHYHKFSMIMPLKLQNNVKDGPHNNKFNLVERNVETPRYCTWRVNLISSPFER